MTSRLHIIAAIFKAFMAAVLTASTLTAVYTLCEGLLAGCATGNCLMPLGTGVQIAFMLSIIYASCIAVCTAPIWVVLQRLQLGGYRSAMALGFLGTIILWLLTNTSSSFGTFSVLRSGLPYALCGAVAGFAAWFAGSSPSSKPTRLSPASPRA